jgi:formylglycine-generating enzyme required for sulfatase activity
MLRGVFFLLVAGALSLGSLGDASASRDADLPTEVTIEDVEFVLIPGGWFFYPIADVDPKSGYSRNSGYRTIRTWVDSYYLGKYEARARHLAAFLNAGKAASAGDYDGSSDNPESGALYGCAVRKDAAGQYYTVAPESDLPATHLSWNIANEWATSLGFRLPTDAEWVRAFRGDDKRLFPWGNDYPDDTFASFEEGGTECNVRPVTGYPKGRSQYGAHNMAGNVFEYVADWVNLEHLAQLKDGVRNPVASTPVLAPDIDRPFKLLRGGRWGSGPTELSIWGNVARRAPDSAFRCYGVRFAIDVASVRRHLVQGTAQIVR